MAQHLDRQYVRKLWEDALLEDGAQHDVTSLIALPEKKFIRASLVPRQAGTFAGVVILDVLREAYPTQLTVTAHGTDGDRLDSGVTLATLTGPLRLLLAIERTLLNFLQRLCGVATLTHQYVDAVADTNARIYDTRKTIPGWRQLDKYAVRCGGGNNHRMGLYDAVLVKDNHLSQVKPAQLVAAVTEMVRAAASLSPPPEFVELEVDTLEQLERVLDIDGIDIILLDNFTPDRMRKAVALRNKLGLAGKIEIEASGGATLDTVRDIAATGVDRIAVGALTHSAPALDIGMDIEAKTPGR